ncbi:hypothetical protein E6W39_17845 [Kitasatospora acidiphila]|uniref:Uncharacterized protein n=1 Tax=Kitasatospora acidiphila TaxID=2567942 RepID=A0A540W5X3_9ACTN|nr:hypothetical protein [Kitasatospora acidiphila]TQF03754.1 hypothetical protein E6W39_17845 [Kitasatospora acidiphila]
MAFRKTLGAIGTTTILAFAAVGAFSPVANAADEPLATIQAQPVGASSYASTATPSTATATPSDPSATAAEAEPAVSGEAHAPQTLSCWNGRTSGAWFYETCNGNSYRPYVDCSNGVRYISSVYYGGEWNFGLKCPVGNAVWGGAIGN